jgi:hypothetical protein
MSGMANEQYVPAFFDQALGLSMDLGNERAGCIDISKRALARFDRNRFGHAVSRKDHRTVVGHFLKLVDEDRAHFFEALDDKAIVDDLMAHIDRRAEALQRELDDLNGTINPGTKAAWGGYKYAYLGKLRHGTVHVRHRLQP